MSNKDIPVYIPKEGTVRISGTTQPRLAGRCAYFFFKKGLPVEFFCIGANANQQAMKSMSIFADLIAADEEVSSKFVAFVPMRYLTNTTDALGEEKEKDSTVWVTYLVSK